MGGNVTVTGKSSMEVTIRIESEREGVWESNVIAKFVKHLRSLP
jgi:acyl-CoA hydrolase